MDFKVLIAESALADLKEIVEFVAADNREAAIRLGERLVAHALSSRCHNAASPHAPFSA
jgi:plasmid stabilization system protein ParE